MFTCIIIEDQPPAQRILKKYISNTDGLLLKKVFADVIKAREYLKQEQIDLIFLDIHLPKISGIEFLKTIYGNHKVILTTAFSEYALESYSYNVIDYLLKPISYERFMQSISKLHLTQTTKEVGDTDEMVFLKSGYELIKLKVSDIIHIKSDSDYTEVTTTQKTYISNYSLKYWLEELNSNSFYQIHKSHLINIKYLVKVTANAIHLTNITLPLGRAYKKHFLEKLNKL